jgi:hypothetical protein
MASSLAAAAWLDTYLNEENKEKAINTLDLFK